MKNIIITILATFCIILLLKKNKVMIKEVEKFITKIEYKEGYTDTVFVRDTLTVTKIKEVKIASSQDTIYVKFRDEWITGSNTIYPDLTSDFEYKFNKPIYTTQKIDTLVIDNYTERIRTVKVNDPIVRINANSFVYQTDKLMDVGIGVGLQIKNFEVNYSRGINNSNMISLKYHIF